MSDNTAIRRRVRVRGRYCTTPYHRPRRRPRSRTRQFISVTCLEPLIFEDEDELEYEYEIAMSSNIVLVVVLVLVLGSYV